MSTSAQKKRRDRLFKECSYCYWCGVLLSHPSEYLITIEGDPKNLKRIRHAKYHMATLDHLDPKHDPHRGKHGGSVPRTVLACTECNNYRNMLFLKSLPKEILWAIGNSPPTVLPFKDFFSTDYDVPYEDLSDSIVKFKTDAG